MLYISISSSVNYKDVALPRLLNCLKRCKNPILVTISGCEHEKNYTKNRIQYFDVEFNAYYYGALITATWQIPENNHVCLLHDTCEVGENFDKIINSFDYKKYDLVDVDNGKYGFGIYSISALLKNMGFLMSCQNIEENKLFRKTGQLYTNIENKTVFPNLNKDFINIKVEDVYQNNELRQVEYYSSIDIYKYRKISDGN